MNKFVKRGEHHYEYGSHNVVLGISLGLDKETTRAKIMSIFPQVLSDLREEHHLSIMGYVPKDDSTVYLPLVEMVFIPDLLKSVMHVHLKVRAPITGVVRGTDTDSFSVNDKNIENIKSELIEHLVSNCCNNNWEI